MLKSEHDLLNNLSSALISELQIGFKITLHHDEEKMWNFFFVGTKNARNILEDQSVVLC